jgi:lysophospholipase L1-like esterase
MFIILVFGLTIGIGLALLQHNKQGYAEYWQGRANIPGDFTLVVIGNSVAQGIGASKPQNSFVGLLASYVAQTTQQSVRVVNLSRSGATTQDALREQAPKLANYPDADLVVLEIGANDMRGYNSDQFQRNYEQLLQDLPPGKSIVTDVPTFSGHPDLTRRAKAANQSLYRLARQYHLPIAPIYETIGLKLATTPWLWIDASDLFHPNDRGYQLWLNAVRSIPGFDRYVNRDLDRNLKK